MKCPACQAELLDQARFCDLCSARIDAPPPNPPAETVTPQGRSAAASERGAGTTANWNGERIRRVTVQLVLLFNLLLCPAFGFAGGL